MAIVRWPVAGGSALAYVKVTRSQHLDPAGAENRDGDRPTAFSSR
jgi:hypothetical protein